MEFNCPHCQIKLELENGAPGQEVACPACHGLMAVPAAAPIKEPAAKTPPAPFSSPAARKKFSGALTDYKDHSGGGGFFKFVILVILLTLLAFGFACFQSDQPPQAVYKRLVDAVTQLISPPTPTPVQEPAAPKPVAPPPVIVAAEPKPLPPPPPANVVVAPPPPSEPDPITWVQEQAQKSTVEITLLADTMFPIIYNGKPAGSGNLPAPSTVRMVKVDQEGGKVTVSYPGYGNGVATVPIASTDLLERARAGLEKAKADAQATKVKSAADAKAEEGRKMAAAGAPSSPPSSLSSAAPQPAAVTNSTNPSPQQKEPVPSTKTAPAETATLNPSPFGSTGGGSTSLGPRTFIHPGIPLTKDDLDEVKRNITREPWKSAFEALKRDPEAQLDRKMYGPFDKVCRTPDINLTPWKRDMNAFYKLSLLWYLTGDEAYAQKSHDVLIAYVKGQKSFGGVEMYLSLGDYADTVLGGADILRGTWPGWTAEDTALSKAYFRNLYAGTINEGAWSIGPLRSANQGALQLINYVCVSVFLDDSEMFNNCVRMFLADPETGLTDTLPNGELGDTGRDQGHAAGELVRTLLAAEVFWKQGVDVYSARDNRLLAMGEFYARYNLNYPTPFMPFGTKYTLFPILPPLPGPGKPSTKIATMIHKAYVTRMGLSAPYSTQAMDAVPFDADTFLYYKIADHSSALPPPPMPVPAPTEPLTDGLENAEIGDASPGGSGDFAGGTWTIRGSGTAGMLNPPWGKWAWRGDDSCHFAYRKVTGDATLIARVTSVEEVQNFTMAGLMIRDSLEPKAGARMAVWSTPNAREKGPSVETDLRGFSHSSHDSPFQIHENAAIPYWLKLERVGDRITCWNSPDGASWTPLENGLFPAMGQTAYLGLFVCSTINGKTATATFDTVRMTGGGGVEQVKTPAAPFAIYGGPGDGQVPLRWLESFGATSYNVKRSEAKGGPYQTVATVKGTSLVDNAVKDGETYYYVVSATNSAGESPNSLEDSVKPRGL